ncbi:SRPBCC family protein [Carbonactinospora thermoautotrophica]|uniref:Polyketide cyclase n=3 Tax=Carbonactinospora thermoautotrophica TaxID=1469144 RepID=A0A132MK56_9ACTN|nr:SRPBCC family protein [Carbonactinospora thermoautotrophica]KWW98129.1 hypothetical protein TH66_23030 [Carbonactinospora thermoautotrophica]MCX9192713.1 SRPBCC family protein [Carbonactinospora thermoautotrophica]
MALTVRWLPVPPEAVFDVLSDGWLYASWVVGASQVRAVSPTWPKPGSKIHHSVGAWPLLINDRTEVVEADPPRRLVLRAHAWPAGAAIVELRFDRDGTGTLVSMREYPVAGPARLLGRLLGPILHIRNVESLKRLGYIAEGRIQRPQRA